MSWSGIQTFAKLPLCLTPADLRAGQIDVAIGGAPWEGTATGRTGTHLGPRAIRGCDYLSHDAADPAFTPGTGTPEPGGLSTGELLRAVRRLAAEIGAVGMDVVEGSPPYDSGNDITAMFANRCVMEALTGTAMRRMGLTQPDYADPRALGRTSAPAAGGAPGNSHGPGGNRA